jgi:glucoamylase
MALTSQAKLTAPGGPGIEPRWTRGAKVAVGTAYSTSSRVWYTLDSGCVTEVYYPTIDTPQIRDLQFLLTDGKTFFHDERRNLCANVDCVSETALGSDFDFWSHARRTRKKNRWIAPSQADREE